MRKKLVAGILASVLLSIATVQAQDADSMKMMKQQQDDSVTVARAQHRIDDNLKDANKAQNKIDKRQKRIAKQERRIKRQERKREKRMNRVEKDQEKISNTTN